MKDHSRQPHPLLDPIVPAIQATALVTAVTSGMMEAIAAGSASPTAIAAACELDPDAVERLANVLVASQYLTRTDNSYQLTEVSRDTLTADSKMKLVNWIRFCRIQLEAITQLESVVNGKGPIDLFALMKNEGDRLTHQRAMAETAGPASAWIADNIPIRSGAVHMLDVGGSHGIYSAAICRRYPPMTAEVFELPAMVNLAQQVAAEFGSDAYCTHVGEDATTARLTKTYDAVFLGNIIHHFSTDQVQAILDKAFAHLAPNGTVAIWDLTESPNSEDGVAACFSLFFYLTSHAKCYSQEEIYDFVAATGFTDLQTFRPPGNSTHALHVARKPNE